jgi:hypothetical protein
MRGWGVVLATCAYAGVHLLAYLVVMRNIPVFRRERGVFTYHAVAFVGLTIGVLAAWATAPSVETTQGAIAGISLQAIYSMSFLEMWSLSQVSYSLAILDAIAARPGLPCSAAIGRFADTGTMKKQSRLSTLERLGLVRTRGGQVTLSPRGRAVAAGLQALRWVANLHDVG